MNGTTLDNLDRAACRRSFVVGMVILVCCGLAAFWPVLTADFSLWDDPETIVENPALNPPTLAGLADRWTAPHMHLYAPLTHTAWFIAAEVAYDCGGAAHNAFGTPMRPWPFKVASVAAHLLTSVAVFALARRIVGPGWPALVAAIVFCVHPLQVEAVGWTSGLKDELCGLFAVTCLLCYADRRRTAIALVAMIAAVLAKPAAFVLPAMLLVVDHWLNGRAWRSAIVRLLPFVLVGALAAAIARGAQPTPRVAVAAVAWFDRPFVAGFAYAFYAAKAIVLWRFGIDYGWNPTAIVRGPWFRIAWLVPAAIATVGCIARRAMPAVAVGVALAAIPLAPVCGLVWFDFSRISVVADHYAYLAMAGVAVVIAAILRPIERSAAARVVAIVVCAVLAGLSMRQARAWSSATTVATNALWVNPTSRAARNHLAVIAVNAGDFDQASSLLNEVLAIDPSDVDSVRALSGLEHARGDDAASLTWARRAVAIDVNDPRSQRALANAAAREGELTEAIAALAQAARYERDPTQTLQQIEWLRRSPATRSVP